MPDEKNHSVHHAADSERGPIGVGSEAAEGLHDVDMKGTHERTGLEHRTPGSQVGSEPLREREWNHGGRGGKPKTSSDLREAGEQNAAPNSAPKPPPTDKGK